MPQRIAAQATFEERGSVWHESCAHPDEVRYPEAVMEADSSLPANIALPLARASIVPGLGVIADTSGVVPFGDPRVRRVQRPYPYLLHEQALPLSCAIVAARRVRALAGHFLERTSIGRFHAFRAMTMLRALVTIRSKLPKPQ
jgi:hypothetical protein